MANTGVINIKTNTYSISSTLRQHFASKLFFLTLQLFMTGKNKLHLLNVLQKYHLTGKASIARYIHVTWQRYVLEHMQRLGESSPPTSAFILLFRQFYDIVCLSCRSADLGHKLNLSLQPKLGHKNGLQLTCPQGRLWLASKLTWAETLKSLLRKILLFLPKHTLALGYYLLKWPVSRLKNSKAF